MRAKPAWHAEARALADQGLSPAEIAERVGRSRQGVWKVLNPERAAAYSRKSNADPRRKAAKRAWDRRNAAPPKMTVDPDPEVPGLLPIRVREGDSFSIVDFARVDIEDWETLRLHRWSRNGVTGYVTTTTAHDRKTLYLHRAVLHIDPATGLECDHINRDKLDNRRSNLRAVTRLENIRNRGGIFEKAAA